MGRRIPGRGKLAAILFLLIAGAARAGDRVPGETWMAYAEPEQAGFSTAKLAEAHEYWRSIRSAALFVVHRGAVLASWGETGRRFRLHSARKSLMSGMYGIFIDRGAIDPEKTLAELGIDDEPPLTEAEKQARIVDLLSARSGVYRLAAYEPPQNPKPPRGSHAPGTHWVYNNWDFNTLLTILEQEAGIRFFEELDVRFARPLGMQDYDPSHGYYHYERQKSVHPAYPLRMSARDLARFGLLYLREGRWGKKRILSEEYVRESTSWISDTGSGGYGYMWWVAGKERLRELGMYSALGVGEQSIDVLPGADLVLVNLVDTYGDGSVSRDQREKLVEMILDARIGEPVARPKLVPLEDTSPSFEPRPLTAEERAAYFMELPVLGLRSPIRIHADDGPLVIDFGEGPIPLHAVGEDHFVIEDFLEDIYFEETEEGSKRLISADLLLLDARLKMSSGNFPAALEAAREARDYFPEDPDVYRMLAAVYLGEAREAIEQAITQYGKVAELRPDETLDRTPLAWLVPALQARLTPPDPAEEDLERFVGRYGPRLIELEDGELYYTRDGGQRTKLRPLGANLFQHERADWFRVRFDTDAQGRVFRLVGLYRDGRRDESPRTAD